MEIKRWVCQHKKTRFQLRILNVPLGKSHIGVWALSYALHLRCEKFLLGWQGNIVSHYIRKKLTVLRKCCIEKSTLHFGATLFEGALKCITLNEMKKSLVHYGDNVLVFASTKKLGFNYAF